MVKIPAASPPVLVVDTSAGEIGVALAFADGSRALMRHAPRGPLSENLRPAIERLLAAEGLGFPDLIGVAAVRGPGSFTGLRVGLAFAEGLAASRGLPATGVGSLDALAAGAAPLLADGTALLALVRSGSRRDDWYAQRFAIAGGEAAPDGGAEVLAGEALDDAVGRAGALAGDRPAGAGAKPVLGRELLLDGAIRLAAAVAAGRRGREPLEPVYLLEPTPVLRKGGGGGA